MSYSKNNSKMLKLNQKTKTILTTLLVIGLFVGAYFGGKELGFWGASPDDTPEVIAPTAYQIVCHDYLDSSNDDEVESAMSFYWYEADIEDLTDDDVADLLFTDFALDETKTGDHTYTPNENMINLVKCNGTDIVEAWYCSDYRIFESKIPLISLGLNNLFFMNETEDASGIGISSPVLTTTLNQTDYRDWSFILRSLDASEATTSKITAKEGYLPYFDPEVSEYYSVCLDFDFNVTTASSSYVSFLSDYEYNKVVDGDNVIIEIYGLVFTSEVEILVKLSSGLGTTFELESVTLCYGYAASNTDWDTL